MWSPQGQSRPIGTSYRHKALSSFASETDRWDSTVLPTLRSGKRKANAPGSSGVGNTTAAKSDAPAPVSRFNYLRERTMARFRGRVDSKFHESVVPNSVLRGNGDRQGDDDDEEDEEQKFFVHEDVHMPFRVQLRHILTSSSVGVAIDLISCALSVIACVFYVWSTYDESLETLFLFIEAGISTFFLLEYMLRFYVTNHRVRFFFSWFSIVDILTIVPVVFDLLLHESITGTSLAFRIIQILRVLRIARLLRIHRVFTYLKTELQRETARFILNMISITFITAAFIFAIENSLREELYVEPLLFHDAYYFTIVTVSTVGFGDIKVYTQLSRAFIVLVIIGSLVYIPMSTNALLRLLSEDSMYRLRRYRPRRARHVLVLGEIHADGALKFLQEFFHPDHGTQGDVHVVFLMSNLPSAELKMVLESQRYEMSVTYLQGSVHSIEDLDRARAWDVAAVFVLARKFTIEEAEVDRSTMMIALAIKQYHYRVLGSPVQICLQLIRPESQKQYALAFQKIGRKNKSYGEINSQQRPSNASITSSVGALTPVGACSPNRNWQQSASVEDVVRSEIKVVPSPMSSSQNRRRVSDSKRRHSGGAVNQNRRDSEGAQSEPLSDAADILALMQKHQALPRQQSSLSVASKTPPQGPQKTGLGPQDIVICTNQLKMELMAKHCLCPGITTFITNLVISLDDDAQRDRGVDSLAPWEKEYRAGCDFELYRTKLTQGFSGIYFEDIALALYMETGTLVIGVEVSAAMHMTDGSTHAKSRLLLNPVGFVIPDTTEFSVHAIVIAQDRASANLSTWRSNPQEPGKGGGGLTASFYGLTAPAQKMSSMKFNTQNTDKPETEASRIEAKVRMYNPTEARPGIEISRKMAEFDSVSLQHQVSSGSGDKRAYGAASERLQRAKIHSQLCEEHPNVKNHVVFIGSTTDLAAFVRILRHKTKGATKNMPVVVLSTTMPSVQTWAALPGEGEHVYIVEGSPLDTFDLKRAGVHYASCAVVSTTQGQMKQAGRALSVDSQRDDSEALAVADADAIFAHQGILRLNPDIEIITEVVNTENIVFLETKSRLLQKAERHLSFHVAPKETADGAHKRLSQVRRMASTLPDAGDEEFDGTVDIGKNDRHTRGLIASGTIFTISLLDALLAQSFYNPKVLAVLEQLLAGESQTDADAAMWTEVLGEASSSLMYVASVPEEFEEATYGDVFRYFCLEKGMLSVGISRGVTLRRAGISTLGNRHRYVLTNPPAETVLQRQDKIFVLALMEPEEETRGGGMLDVLSAFQQKRPGLFAAGENAAPAAITSLLPTTKPGTGGNDEKSTLPSSKALHPVSELRESSASATSKSEAPAFELGGNLFPSTQRTRQSKRSSTLDSGGMIDLAEEIREEELLEIDKDEEE